MLVHSGWMASNGTLSPIVLCTKTHFHTPLPRSALGLIIIYNAQFVEFVAIVKYVEAKVHHFLTWSHRSFDNSVLWFGTHTDLMTMIWQLSLMLYWLSKSQWPCSVAWSSPCNSSLVPPARKGSVRVPVKSYQAPPSFLMLHIEKQGSLASNSTWPTCTGVKQPNFFQTRWLSLLESPAELLLGTINIQ